MTCLLLVGMPAGNQIYWIAANQAGVPRPDGNSSVLDLIALTLFALVLAPILLGITWFCLRRYNPDARLLAWRSDQLLRSSIATLLFGGTAVFLTFLVVTGLTSGGPWYDQVPIIYLGLWIPWALMLRAALIEQQSAGSQQEQRPSGRTSSTLMLVAFAACIVGATATLLMLSFGIITSVFALVTFDGPAAEKRFAYEELFWNQPVAWISLLALLAFGAGIYASIRFARRPIKPAAAALALLLTVLAVVAYVDLMPF
jgi:hypothetical protein